MALIRSLLFAATFYPATLLWVLGTIFASLFGRRATFAVVLNWVAVHRWLLRHVLGIEVRVVGSIPEGPHLLAVKHQSMLETVQMARIGRLPVIVMKRELGRIPLFGWVTRRYGVIEVEREAGARALREMVAHGKAAAVAGRSVIIYPEGTRVRPGETPPLRAGFAGLYRALGLPVVPIAMDSGRLWGTGLVKRSGTVTFKVGDTIPPGLKRDEIEARVHRAINALELAPKPGA